MPQKKNNKKKKGPTAPVSREFITKDNGQEYALVLKMLGDSRLKAKCYDGIERLCHIRGKMRKRIWIAPGDHILIALRDFTTKTCDVIHKYTEDEVRRLKKMKQLTDIITEHTENIEEEDDTGFTFDEI